MQPVRELLVLTGHSCCVEDILNTSKPPLCKGLSTLVTATLGPPGTWGHGGRQGCARAKLLPGPLICGHSVSHFGSSSLGRVLPLSPGAPPTPPQQSAINIKAAL